VVILDRIEQWVDQLNEKYSEQRVSCNELSKYFKGFYKKSFLKKAYFVVVDRIPKPDFPELRQMGLGGFIDMNVDGITYKDTYYIKQEFAQDLRLHFHELVHVAQWKHLGAAGFIERYISEINKYGYDNAPLEIMAYSCDSHFASNGERFDVPRHVKVKI
jgi:hypothetical protein